jgi:hypothetical protein
MDKGGNHLNAGGRGDFDAQTLARLIRTLEEVRSVFGLAFALTLAPGSIQPGRSLLSGVQPLCREWFLKLDR